MTNIEELKGRVRRGWNETSRRARREFPAALSGLTPVGDSTQVRRSGSTPGYIPAAASRL